MFFLIMLQQLLKNFHGGCSIIAGAVLTVAAAAQTPGRPIFGPAAATADRTSNLVEAGPLYAGETVSRIADIRPAGELVRELAS